MSDAPQITKKSLADLITRKSAGASGNGFFGGGRLAALGFVAAVYFTAQNCFFTVDPAERAFVRQFGQVTTEKAFGPGLHMRLPFVTSVDRAQVSLTNLHIPVFSVNTIDNQKIDLDINVSYLTPESAVFHLLYEVGRSGNADIRENVVPVVQDRISRIFSVKNTNNISELREGIQAETTIAVRTALKDLFKIDLQSLQIAKIIYSQAFIASNERSVLAKNEAIAEENRVKVAEFQAKQRVTTAEGEAQQARAKASGDADALRLRAKAEKEAAELQGQGSAARYKSEIDGAGGFENYINVLNAQARLRWDGVAPRFMMGGDKGAPNFLMSLPDADMRAQQPAAPASPAATPPRR